jgi:hypothetical protein
MYMSEKERGRTWLLIQQDFSRTKTLSSLGVTEGSSSEWPDWLRALAVSFRRELLRHPRLIPLIARWPVLTPDSCVQLSEWQRKLMRLTHVMCFGTSATLMIVLQGLAFSGRLNTAFNERVNLTVRHRVAWLARCTWATVKSTPQLLVHLGMVASLLSTLCVPIQRYGRPSCSHEREVAS